MGCFGWEQHVLEKPVNHERIAMVSTWEKDYRELFAGCGPDVPKDERALCRPRNISVGPSLA
jgi:hypothetical protein